MTAFERMMVAIRGENLELFSKLKEIESVFGRGRVETFLQNYQYYWLSENVCEIVTAILQEFSAFQLRRGGNFLAFVGSVIGQNLDYTARQRIA